jgi:carboxypeptidase Q
MDGRTVCNHGRIRDAAMTDPNAYNMLAHLTDNVGPRLSGSLQAQASVEWVGAKTREMGTSVTLKKRGFLIGYEERKTQS